MSEKEVRRVVEGWGWGNKEGRGWEWVRGGGQRGEGQGGCWWWFPGFVGE